MTVCVCGGEIVTYYTDGENPSMWLHTAYGQPECLSTTLATPLHGEVLPSVECICGEIFTGGERKYERDVHSLGCQVIQNLLAKE